MLATETFVKLCSIYMVMDAHVSSRQTSIANGSGLAHVRLGTDSSNLNQKIKVDVLEFGNYLHRIAIVAVTCFMNSSLLSDSISIVYSSL